MRLRYLYCRKFRNLFPNVLIMGFQSIIFEPKFKCSENKSFFTKKAYKTQYYDSSNFELNLPLF